MASQERGLNLPVPGVGERLRGLVKRIKEKSGHGITQAGIITPEKQKTEDLSGLTQEELDKLIPPFPGSSKEPPKNKKPWIQRKVGKLTVGISLGTLALGGAGYAVNEAYQNNHPAISRPAETAAPASFDNKANKGVIDSTNTISMSIKEIEQKFPEQIVEDHEKATATIIFPLNAPEGSKIEFSTRVINPKDGNFAPDQDATINIRNLTVPKGTEISFKMDGRIAFTRDGDKIVSVVMFYYDEKKDIVYTIGVVPPFIPSPYSLDPEPSIEIADRNTPRPTSGTYWESSPMVKKGTVVAITNQDQPLSITIKATKGKDVWQKQDKEPGKRWMLSPQFSTERDVSDVEKLVVMGKEN